MYLGKRERPSAATGGPNLRKVLTINPNFSDYVVLPSKINPQGSTFLIDTQADVSLIKLIACSKINLNKILDKSQIINIKGITSFIISSLGTISVKLYAKNYPLICTLHVVPDEFDIPSDGILGKDFLKQYRSRIDNDDSTLTLRVNNREIIVPIQDGPDKSTVVLPARCESIRAFHLKVSEDCVIPNQEIAPGVLIPNTIISSENPFVQVMNTNPTVQILPKNIAIVAESLNNYSVYKFQTTSEKPDRRSDLLRSVSTNANLENEDKFLELIDSFNDIFHMDGDKMSVNNFYEQKLRIADNTPVYIKNYRLPFSQKDEIKTQIKKLLDNELIEPSTSNYNSPILLVPKKGDQWRLCIDYRQVNKKLIADKYPLPRIEDILDNLGRAKYFSILDLYSGFHQIPLDENSRDVTSFSTEDGSFRWKVLPFGLNVSPNSFARMMALAFAGASPLQCFIYMDDIHSDRLLRAASLEKSSIRLPNMP